MTAASVRGSASSRAWGPSDFLLALFLVWMLTFGGSEAGVYLAPFRVLNAVLGAFLVGWWMLALRRSADRTDLLAVGGLLAFVVSCAASDYPRQSFDAATGALVWAAAFGVARRRLFREPQRVLCLAIMAVAGAGIGVQVTLAWGGIWLEWLRVTGAAPPLDLWLPPLLYRHYYFVAMLLAGLAPALAWAANRLVGWPAAALSGGWLLALAALSGSRTVWLGIALAALVAVISVRPDRRLILVTVGGAAVVISLGIVAGFATGIADRALVGSTISLRFDVWRETFALAAGDPITGLGPGAWGIGIAQSPLMDTHLHYARHPDNALVELVGEAGVLGLCTAVLLIGAVAVGRRLDLVGAKAALFGLILIAAFTLTNNPTDTPIIVVVIVAYGALLAPHATDPQGPEPNRGKATFAVRAASTTAAVVIGIAILSTSVASLRHYDAIKAARAGDWASARESLVGAIALDPAMALYHREYGSVLAASGYPAAALDSLTKAVGLNPADAAAWRSLAVTLAESGEPERAAEAASRAVDLRPLAGENALTLALVTTGDVSEQAVAQALLVEPWLTGSPAWDPPLPTGQELAHLFELAIRQSDPDPTLRELPAATWLGAAAGQSGPVPSLPADLAALHAMLTCDLPRAGIALDALGPGWTDSTYGGVAKLMYASLTDTDELSNLRLLARLRLPIAVETASLDALPPMSLAADPVADAQLYRRLAMGASTPGRAVPRKADAIPTWTLDPVAAAAAGAPASGLARCHE